MKDLLKEAIADAKAVRETALANAKLALEEAFTPRIQSMISSHLQQEAEGEEMMDEDDDEMMADEMPVEEPAAEAPAVEMPAEEPAMEDEMSEEEDIDLEEIIRELEGEDDDMAEGDDMVDDTMSEGEGEKSDDDVSEGDEEVDLEEVIRSLREEDDSEEKMDEAEEEKEEMKEELQEAYKVITFLRSKINEVNLLNAKLLYSNKLFRTYSLNESQKLKVIENFDRAHSIREVKLLYTALAENFTGTRNKKVVKESFASKPVASTKPAQKTVINEGDVLANRFKKLAGLIK